MAPDFKGVVSSKGFESLEDEKQTEARRKANADFKIERANAIDRFTTLESRLQYLFGILTFGPQMKPEFTRKEWIIFWGLQSFNLRLKIMSDLIKVDYPDNYGVFFPSLVKMIEGINTVRNRIVHWQHMDQHRGGHAFDPRKDTFLSEPPPGRRAIYQHELVDFSNRARFLSNLTWEFAAYLRHPDDQVAAGKKRWKDVFAESVVYPPLREHPLFDR